eukprot:UN03948
MVNCIGFICFQETVELIGFKLTEAKINQISGIYLCLIVIFGIFRGKVNIFNILILEPNGINQINQSIIVHPCTQLPQHTTARNDHILCTNQNILKQKSSKPDAKMFKEVKIINKTFCLSCLCRMQGMINIIKTRQKMKILKIVHYMTM